MLRPNKTKQAMQERKAVFGTITLMSDPWVVEIVGNAGYDFIAIDLEHTALDLSQAENLIRAAEATDLTPMVRVPALDRKTISRMMDSGAQGLLLPLVEDYETAQKFSDYARYPPRGMRSTCSMVRAAERGLWRSNFQEYVTHVNDNVLLAVLVETRKGVENIDSILDADVDVVFIGRGDLSADLGLYYGVDHPEVMSMCDTVIERTEARPGRWAGMLCYEADEAENWVRRGCNFMMYSQPELVLSRNYSQTLNRLRSAAASVTA